MPPTPPQVEKTKTVEAAAPHYDDQFIFKTKQNANDMIMMKIVNTTSPNAAVSVFGSVALPLDFKHTQGKQIPMPIFDEGLNMKGIVRVAAAWSTPASGTVVEGHEPL